METEKALDTGVVAEDDGSESWVGEGRGLPYRSPSLVVHGSLVRLTGGGTEQEPEDFFSGSIRST